MFAGSFHSPPRRDLPSTGQRGKGKHASRALRARLRFLLAHLLLPLRRPPLREPEMEAHPVFGKNFAKILPHARRGSSFRCHCEHCFHNCRAHVKQSCIVWVASDLQDAGSAAGDPFPTPAGREELCEATHASRTSASVRITWGLVGVPIPGRRPGGGQVQELTSLRSSGDDSPWATLCAVLARGRASRTLTACRSPERPHRCCSDSALMFWSADHCLGSTSHPGAGKTRGVDLWASL